MSAYRVLVADDTLANRTLMRAYLSRLGFDSIMAEDGVDALEKFETEKPDIILMDLMMPRMDGFEATRHIKQSCESHWVPVIIISAMGAEADIVKGLEAGADDYLTKPLSYQIFAAKMQNLSRSLGLQKGAGEAYQRISAISNAVIDGIITADINGAIIDSNAASQNIFGYTAQEFLTIPFVNLIAPSSRGYYQARVTQMLQDPNNVEESAVFELVGQRKSEHEFPLELGLSQLELSGQKLLISIARDVTQRKLVEQKLAEDATRLQEYHDEAEHEGELAKEIMERLIQRDGLADPRIKYFVMPAQRFSGDLVLAATSETGRQYIMLADATGHGLAAAVSVLPVLTMFYRGAARDKPLANMIVDINNELDAMLPLGRFVSAAFVCLDRQAGKGEVWVGGVPDVLSISSSGALVERFVSSELPMGISNLKVEQCTPQSFGIQPGNQLVLCSDGLVEATNVSGQIFGFDGLLEAMQTDTADRLERVHKTLNHHLNGTAAHDDVSLLLVDL